jgi:hypothetical protein
VIELLTVVEVSLVVCAVVREEDVVVVVGISEVVVVVSVVLGMLRITTLPSTVVEDS